VNPFHVRRYHDGLDWDDTKWHHSLFICWIMTW
jgi:hypothetical protein